MRTIRNNVGSVTCKSCKNKTGYLEIVNNVEVCPKCGSQLSQNSGCGLFLLVGLVGMINFLAIKVFL